ncbi:MAG TPA: NTPase [Thermoleophilaceae bacterium]|nr:NTPase [Thermoleophilaceae bacterium]
MAARLLIEARPGAGKTTALGRLAELLRDAGVQPAGFLTREMREDRRRVGFEIETFDGERGLLAHVDIKGSPRVGRYGVDLEEFERVALPALEAPGDVILLDELGKMELASERFREKVLAVFDSAAPIVATVHTARHPVTDKLKQRAGVSTVRLTAANRDTLPGELLNLLRDTG